MPLLPVEGVAKVEVGIEVDGAPGFNIFHVFANDGPWSGAQLNDYAQDFANAFEANFGLVLSSAGQITSVKVTDLSSEVGAQVEIAPTGDMAFDVAEDPCPMNVAYVVSWHIDRRYRGGHPRTYLFPVPRSVVDPDNPRNVTDAHRDNVVAAANFFAVAVEGLAFDVATTALCTVHYTRKTGLEVPPATTTILDPPQVDIIQRGSANLRLDSQRRRLGR